MHKYHYFSLLFLFVSTSISSQVSNLNGPLSWHIKQDVDKSNIPTLVLPKFNLKKQLNDDSIAAHGVKKPYKFGKEFVANLDFMKKSGSLKLKKGRICRYEIISDGAICGILNRDISPTFVLISRSRVTPTTVLLEPAAQTASRSFPQHCEPTQSAPRQTKYPHRIKLYLRLRSR